MDSDVAVDALSIAMIYNDLANSYMGISEYKKALTLQQRALKLIKNIDELELIKNSDETSHYIALIKQNMALAYQYLGQYEKALELGKKL